MDCTVERRQLVTRYSMDFATGTLSDESSSEWETRQCGAPLFTDDERKLGVCRSCRKGWSHELNFPTEAGLSAIEAANQRP